MSDLDLNLNNYNLNDLIKFFRLPNPFTSVDVELQENKIRNLLLHSGHIGKQQIRDFILFLEGGKTKLIDDLKSKEKTEKYIAQPREDDIIPVLPNPVVYTKPTDIVPGNRNPFDNKTLTRCVSIDTRFRPSSYTNTSSDFPFSLPNKINNVLSLECNSFEVCARGIPNISSSLGNHYLYVSITTFDERQESKVFVLPTGHYTISLLIDTLNELFCQQKHTPFLFLEWKLDPFGTRKIILAPIQNQPQYTGQIKHVDLNFTFNESGKPDKSHDFFAKLGRVLGFTKHKYTGKTFYMGETIANAYVSIPYLYLSVEDFQNRSSPSFEPAFTQINSPQSILARIVPLVIHEEEDEQILQPVKLISIPRIYFGPVNLKKFQIRLLDPYGSVVDMNHNDFSCSLLLKTVYET